MKTSTINLNNESNINIEFEKERNSVKLIFKTDKLINDCNVFEYKITNESLKELKNLLKEIKKIK